MRLLNVVNWGLFGPRSVRATGTRATKTSQAGKDLAVLARAGFPLSLAKRVLADQGEACEEPLGGGPDWDEG